MIRLSSAVVGISVSCAGACPAPPDAIALTPEATGAPSAFAMLDMLPLSQPFRIEVVFCNVEKGGVAALKFDAHMPAHQHGMNFLTDVTKLGENRFEVSNVVLHMPGTWEFRVEADFLSEVVIYTTNVELE